MIFRPNKFYQKGSNLSVFKCLVITGHYAVLQATGAIDYKPIVLNMNNDDGDGWKKYSPPIKLYRCILNDGSSRFSYFEPKENLHYYREIREFTETKIIKANTNE